jgi:hypothetical protein
MGLVSQIVLVFSSLLLISPSVVMTATGAVIAAPVLGLNWLRARARPTPA